MISPNKSFSFLKFGLFPRVVGQVISPPLHLGNYQNPESFICKTADHTSGFVIPPVRSVTLKQVTESLTKYLPEDRGVAWPKEFTIC